MNEYIGKRVEIWGEDEFLAEGVLKEIGIDYDNWEEVLQSYDVDTGTKHTPVVEVPSDSMVSDYAYIGGKLCLIKSHNHVHIAPANAIYPSSAKLEP